MDRTTIDLLQGTLGVLILKSVSRAPLHGYGIARWIEEVTGDEVLIEDGSLYPALHRLQAMKLLTSEWGVSESGRRVKRYTITEQGRAQLRAETSRWQRFSARCRRRWERGRDPASAKTRFGGAAPWPSEIDRDVDEEIAAHLDELRATNTPRRGWLPMRRRRPRRGSSAIATTSRRRAG